MQNVLMLMMLPQMIQLNLLLISEGHVADGCNGAMYETMNFFSDQCCWDRFLNEFARHVAFLKLKISESYMLQKIL
jgi:hypothetical protein